ncbi:MAG: OmpA family protein [Gemmatimonadetes bacterium]|nr:OmpA family protein [Gemmatimonadota bacterium]
MAAHAQLANGTARDGASGVHVLVGGFVGRFDLDGAGRTDLFGGRAGVGFGQIAQVTGFYWRGFDRSADSITADNAWGGELQFNLNAGFGLTPFITGGVARVHNDGSTNQTAAIAGAGLTFPLGPVLLHAGARDYMFGVTGLAGDDSPDEVTHNWLYSAGVKFAIGARRRRSAIVAAPPPPEQAALRDANARLAALRDSLYLAASATDPADTAALRARMIAIDSLVTQRNYQSGRSIEIPIPTEGSITLRYGPERPAAAQPIVVTAPGTVPVADVVSQSALSPLPAAPAGATLDDPATQAWLRQVVAAQVAEQVARQMASRPAAAPALTQAQLDAISQRVLDGVIASVVPQLDAAQARRMAELRDDLRVALTEQRADFARTAAAGAASRPPAASAGAVIPRADEIPAANIVDPGIDEAGSVRAAADRARADAAIAATRAEAAQRSAITRTVSEYPRFLAAAETDRGPAAVVGDAAFESGMVLVSSAARPAVESMADVLRAHPDRRIYIQGHTDGAGGELENQRLSELRAEAVRSLLVQAGIETDRLFAIGYGQARPIADNATPGGRALNRRVEIVIGESRSAAAR